MKIDKIELSGGTFNFEVPTWRGRIFMVVSVLLTGEFHGKCGTVTILNANSDNPLAPAKLEQI